MYCIQVFPVQHKFSISELLKFENKIDREVTSIVIHDTFTTVNLL